MLFEQLKAYAEERMDLPSTLYNWAPVRYIIELDSHGRLLTPEPIDTADPPTAQRDAGRPARATDPAIVWNQAAVAGR